MMKNEYALGLLTVLFWSTSATAFKITLQYLDVLQLLLFSVFTAVLILGIYLAVAGKFREIFRLGKKEYGFCLFLGILNPFVYYWMAIKAYDLLPAQVVQPINYTWVITLSLLSVPLLKQSLSRTQIAATLICYAGVIVLSWRGNSASGTSLNRLGIFLAISCTLIWSLYWIFNVRSNRDPAVAIFLNFLFSLPFVALACLFFSPFAQVDPKGIYGAAWIGCFEFGLAFITWITALKTAKNTHHITNLIFLTPVISLVLIHLILGEQILPQTFSGLFLILSGIGVQKYGEYKTSAHRSGSGGIET